MAKGFLFAVLFVIVGLVGFALLAPLVFTGDLQAIGALVFPIIVVVCGVGGFLFGWRRSKKK